MELQDKVILVTGGGTGIGRATALMLAARGAVVAINFSRSEKEALETLHQIEHLGGRGCAYQADVANEQEVQAMAASIAEAYGTIDGLVNNASITVQIGMDNLDAVTDEVWDTLFKVNVKGMFHCVRAVVPYMQRQKSGVIVNMGSVAGITGIGSSIPYAATKSAIHTMTKSLAIALSPHIRVNSIAPGAVGTRWWSGNEERMHQLAGNLPLRRISTPEDIAGAVIFQITQDSLTGQVLVIDNGQTL
ncbi:SDR family oxidoreductase [Paenibacillus sp. FSL R7-0273]|uniref:SDR family NAD(P)-dependent oxidoreductase n=1 Tax=Paenibacillus sp. FSL R7-0273 TaxID=1536772 RepID=UPI0009DF809D|nr:SDR family oxidoreductase [Paenibacillus sp. FSL R7-0273]